VALRRGRACRQSGYLGAWLELPDLGAEFCGNALVLEERQQQTSQGNDQPRTHIVQRPPAHSLERRPTVFWRLKKLWLYSN
jgi:hypothetical protein